MANCRESIDNVSMSAEVLSAVSKALSGVAESVVLGVAETLSKDNEAFAASRKESNVATLSADEPPTEPLRWNETFVFAITKTIAKSRKSIIDFVRIVLQSYAIYSNGLVVLSILTLTEPLRPRKEALQTLVAELGYAALGFLKSLLSA